MLQWLPDTMAGLLLSVLRLRRCLLRRTASALRGRHLRPLRRRLLACKLCGALLGVVLPPCGPMTLRVLRTLHRSTLLWQLPRLLLFLRLLLLLLLLLRLWRHRR